MKHTIHAGDVANILPTLDADSFDAVLCDPPYGLNFKGKKWDHGVPSKEVWSEVLRVLKPGAHVMAFGGTRTFHRLTCAIEDSGFAIRDCLSWLYGSGFPKGHNVSKAIDKAAGVEREVVGERRQRGTVNGSAPMNTCSAPVEYLTAPATPLAQQFDGYGTALKPAWEPVILAMKATDGTFAANALEHGVAGLNIDGSRIGKRWPANLILDEEAGPAVGDAARFFYCSKAPKKERGDSKHPTLKPLSLTEYLAKMLLPPPHADGTPRRILVPFSGAGSEMIGCLRAGWDDVVGIEIDPQYVADAEERITELA